MDSDGVYLFFSQCPHVGPKTFFSLCNHFGSAERAYSASRDELKEAGLGPKRIEAFIQFRETFDVGKALQALAQKHIWLLPSNAFPQQFFAVVNKPILLFGVGNKDVLFESHTVGIVGSRKPTSYGVTVTESFTRDLVAAGFVIVSGMAMGVDGIAHRTSLASGGKTIAVLGSGIDVPTPEMNVKLYHEIIENGGAVVSEYPPGLQPNHGTFPARNRIISGLSQAILIPEATENSGALITARNAFDEGKKVFAVPGQITSNLSKGTTGLLKSGGIMATGAQDILDEMDVSFSLGSKEKEDINDPILKLLLNEGKSTDQLVRESEKSTHELSSHLTMLELSGEVEQKNGKWELKV